MNDLTLVTKNLELGEDISKEKIQSAIAEMEALMLAQAETVETPLKHYFSRNLYAREMTIPKDTFVVGKIHKYQSLSIVSKGDISVLSIDGVMRVKAPCTIVASPGTKRLVYAHEETVWTVIHSTSETDLEKIEAEVIAKDYSEVEVLDHKNMEVLCPGD